MPDGIFTVNAMIINRHVVLLISIEILAVNCCYRTQYASEITKQTKNIKQLSKMEIGTKLCNVIRKMTCG